MSHSLVHNFPNLLHNTDDTGMNKLQTNDVLDTFGRVS